LGAKRLKEIKEKKSWGAKRLKEIKEKEKPHSSFEEIKGKEIEKNSLSLSPLFIS